MPFGRLLRDLPALLEAARDCGDDLVFLCRSGGRSQMACELAAAAGLAAPLNLAGGLLVWARDVDSGFEVPLPSRMAFSLRDRRRGLCALRARAGN